jgi:hypothetical protein
VNWSRSRKPNAPDRSSSFESTDSPSPLWGGIKGGGLAGLADDPPPPTMGEGIHIVVSHLNVVIGPPCSGI